MSKDINIDEDFGLLSCEDVAKIFQCSTKWVRDKLRHEIGCVKLGKKKIYFTEEQIKSYIERCKTAPISR